LTFQVVFLEPIEAREALKGMGVQALQVSFCFSMYKV